MEVVCHAIGSESAEPRPSDSGRMNVAPGFERGCPFHTRMRMEVVCHSIEKRGRRTTTIRLRSYARGTRLRMWCAPRTLSTNKVPVRDFHAPHSVWSTPFETATRNPGILDIFQSSKDDFAEFTFDLNSLSKHTINHFRALRHVKCQDSSAVSHRLLHRKHQVIALTRGTNKSAQVPQAH